MTLLSIEAGLYATAFVHYVISFSCIEIGTSETFLYKERKKTNFTLNY